MPLTAFSRVGREGPGPRFRKSRYEKKAISCLDGKEKSLQHLFCSNKISAFVPTSRCSCQLLATKNHLFFFSGWKIGAIWVRTAEKAAELRKQFDEARVPIISANYEQILQDPSIDLVSIVTPPPAHRDMSVLALRAGKHTLCDKPTALNAEQAAEMAKTARKRPHLLSLIDHELRLLSNYKRMKEIIAKESENFGKLRHIELSVKIPPQPNQKWNWWQDKTAGGGMLGAVGSHFVDLISFLTSSPMVSVSGHLEQILPTLPDAASGEHRSVTSDHYASVHFKLASGAFGVLQMTIAPFQDFEVKLTLAGTKGTAVFDKLELVVKSASGVEKFTEPPAPEGVGAQESSIGTYLLAFELHRAILQLKSRPSTAGPADVPANSLISECATFDDGLYSQVVLDTVRTSSESSKWERIPAGPSRK